MDLPESIFGMKITPALLHQAFVTQMANTRQVIAHTKGRGEVRGGGKKPWRQKGTGRARHGSIRSPIWVGGGVTFGPTKERNFKKKINKKMKRKAVLMALSTKASDKEMIVVDKFELDKPKTKDLVAFIEKMIPGGEGTVMIIEKKNEALQKSGRNIESFKIISLGNMNVADLLNYKYLIVTADAVDAIKEKYKSKLDSKTQKPRLGGSPNAAIKQV